MCASFHQASMCIAIDVLEADSNDTPQSSEAFFKIQLNVFVDTEIPQTNVLEK